MRPSKEKAYDSLTPRELEVVALVGEGLTNKEIAEVLVVRECTVENHLHSIFRKLNMKTRTQVARYAWQRGIRRIFQEPRPKSETGDDTPEALND
jgi:DNA-binding NarL/FixJ family response regulator